jgi:prolipoprotein diacylglyceryl transferase
MSAVLAYIPPPPTNGFHIGPLFFHFYGLAIAIGVLCAFWLARKRWQELGRDPAQIEIAGIWAVVAGFIGGQLAYVSTHSGDFRGRWLHVFAIWEGGLALYGGLTLGILTGIWVVYRRGLPVLVALDAAIPGIPLAQAFGRWGNYFNQELFGTPTKVPWALEVEQAHRPLKYQAFGTFHPTFLYESLWDLAIVGTLLWLSARRKLHTGSIVLCYLAMYAFGRFLLELIRTDTTFRLFGLSRNAYVSLAVVAGAGTWLYLRERHGPAIELATVAASDAGAPAGPDAGAPPAGPDDGPAEAEEAAGATGEGPREAEAPAAAPGEGPREAEEAEAPGGLDAGAVDDHRVAGGATDDSPDREAVKADEGADDGGVNEDAGREPAARPGSGTEA